MTVPSEPDGSSRDQSPAPAPAPALIDTLRLIALALPVVVAVAFVGVIWLVGILVPPAHANCQRTGRQALAMVRLLVPPL
jgi:ABC-type Mn2+/Zn2+ transport system permease subunit